MPPPPHVVALNYKIEHHSSVDYDKASPLDRSEGDFEIHVEGNDVRFAMNRHYATQSEAIESIQSYIRSWELHAALGNGPNEFRLVFDRPEIEDRDLTPGIIVSSHHERITVSDSVSHHVSRGAYPRPPSRKMEVSPEVKLMFDRYVGYRAGREPLTSMANFCLTVLLRNPYRARRIAVRRRQGTTISIYKVLQEGWRALFSQGRRRSQKGRGYRAGSERAGKTIPRRGCEGNHTTNG